jgi:hypothetical protein
VKSDAFAEGIVKINRHTMDAAVLNTAVWQSEATLNDELCWGNGLKGAARDASSAMPPTELAARGASC